MAILKAGPFANSTESFFNEPSPVLPSNFQDSLIIPSNCASEFPFKCYVSRFYRENNAGQSDAEFKLSESGELGSVNLESQPRSHSVYLMFRYQAAQDFSVNLKYTISASATSARVAYLVSKKIGLNSKETIDSKFNHQLSGDPINLDEGINITLEASVNPKFVGFSVNFTVSPGASSDLTSESSIIITQ
jgi:hypothetical protein